MSAVERAAEVMKDIHARRWLAILSDGAASEIAEDLIAAGFHDGPKLTDADRAVLDAADAEITAKDRWSGARSLTAMSHQLLNEYQAAKERTEAAVRARRETQP